VVKVRELLLALQGVNPEWDVVFTNRPDVSFDDRAVVFIPAPEPFYIDDLYLETRPPGGEP
jgi:hypothetical protein